MGNKAVFLDRDGTINVDASYIGRPEDVVLLPGAAEAVRRINEAGYLALVITNQSGVARGYFSLADADRVNARLQELLQEQGAHIDEFYICPHLPGAPVKEFDVDCDCRKPRTGLFRRAIAEHDLTPSLCFACGDRQRDVENLPDLGLPQSHLAVLGPELDLLGFTARL